jgi:hypothetical protein
MAPLDRATIRSGPRIAIEESMGPTPRLSIVIIYSHPLLGEGIGRLLRGEPGARVTFIPSATPDRLERASRAHPDLILVERGSSLDALEVMARFPEALVIDFAIGPGPTWVYRRQEIPGNPEAILQLIRRLRGGHPVVSLDDAPRDVQPILVGPRE